MADAEQVERFQRLAELLQAFAELETAYQARTEDLLYLKVKPQLDSLRADPRFADLLRNLNLRR